jgi:hypothetical protein
MTAAIDEARLIGRYRLQVAFAVACTVLTIAAAVLPMWIESLTRLEPDGGNGELEWLLAVGAGLVSMAFGVLAYRTRRQLARVQADRTRG